MPGIAKRGAVRDAGGRIDGAGSLRVFVVFSDVSPAQPMPRHRSLSKPLGGQVLAAIHLLVEFVNANRFMVYVNWGAVFCDGLFGRIQTSDVM